MKNIDSYKGFSLLEMLIATFLGLFLIEIILQNYLSVKNIYRAQNNRSTLSENIRFADFILWQNIMQAGPGDFRKISDLESPDYVAKGFGISKFIYGYDAGNISSYLLKKEAVSDSDIIVIAKASPGVGCFEKIYFFVAKTRRLDKKDNPIYSLYYSDNLKRKEELVPGIDRMKILYGVKDSGSIKYFSASEVSRWDRVLSVIINLELDNFKEEKRICIKLRGRG